MASKNIITKGQIFKSILYGSIPPILVGTIHFINTIYPDYEIWKYALAYGSLFITGSWIAGMIFYTINDSGSPYEYLKEGEEDV